MPTSAVMSRVSNFSYSSSSILPPRPNSSPNWLPVRASPDARRASQLLSDDAGPVDFFLRKLNINSGWVALENVG